jgi:trigger factor
MRPATALRLRNSLLLREIAKRENIEVSDADIDTEVESLVAGSEHEDRMREMYTSERYLRGMLRNDLFDRQLTDRLIEIATEGRGATINGWTEDSVKAEETETEAKPAGAKKKAAAKAKKTDEDAGEEKQAAEAEE